MSSDNTALGDRMKWYERRYTDQIFLPTLPVIARVDGRAFHTFTAGLKRPYDKRLSDLMVLTTKFLVQETNARVGYTQSDEISLAYYAEDWDSEIFFGGKLLKMTSVIGSLATYKFNKHIAEYLPEKAEAGKYALFDNRVFQVPNVVEAANYFVWREMDATRNSIQMAARAHFSHKECENKDCSDLQEMLFSEHEINWNDYPRFFKRGTYVRRRSVNRPFNAEELAALPEKHEARRNPDLIVQRNVVMEEDFPPITKIENRAEVLILGADPFPREDL